MCKILTAVDHPNPLDLQPSMGDVIFLHFNPTVSENGSIHTFSFFWLANEPADHIEFPGLDLSAKLQVNQ